MNQRAEVLRFVVPAFNEERNLPHLLGSIRKFLAFFGERGEIWVVDDGSTDRTVEVVRAAAAEPFRPCPQAGMRNCLADVPIHVVSHGCNRGPGAAFATGFKAALAEAADEDLIVTIEADNTSDLTILNRMIERARRGSDLVLASVYGEGRVVGAPWERRLLSLCANMLVKTVFGFRGLHTFSSFFRLHRASALRRAFAEYGDDFITEPGFVCVIEMLVKLRRQGIAISEVPMLLDSNIRLGDSKMKILRTSSSYARLFYHLGLHRGPEGDRPPQGVRPTSDAPAAGPGPAMPPTPSQPGPDSPPARAVQTGSPVTGGVA